MPNGECDPFSDTFDIQVCGTAPPFVYTGGFVSTPGSYTTIDVNVTTPPIKVDVSTPPTFPQTIIDGVGKVITGALTGLGTTLGNTLSSLNLLTVIAINQAVSGMGQVVADAIKGLGTAISNLQSVNSQALGAVGSQIAGSIATAFTNVTPHLDGIGTTIAKSINDLHTAVSSALLVNNASIFAGLVPAVTDVGTKLNQLHLDIINPITGLVAIPVAIAGGLERVHDVLYTGLTSIGFESNAELTTDLKFPTTALDPKFVDSFWQPLLQQPGPVNLGSMFQTVFDFITKCETVSVVKAYETFNQKMENAPGWVKWIIEGIIDVTTVLAATSGLIEQQIELAIQQAHLICPIELLGVKETLEALHRNYITPDYAANELGRHGISPTKQGILLALEEKRLDVNTLMTAYHQQTLLLPQLINGLQQLHYSPEQIQVIIRNGEYLPSMEEAMEWYSYGRINDVTLDLYALKHGISEDNFTNMKYVAVKPETTQQYIMLNGRVNAIGRGYLDTTSRIGPIPDVYLAAARDRITPGNMEMQWMAHWNWPNYQTIMKSWFRGTRTLDELHSAFMAENIPLEFWPDLQDQARPLLPARSIAQYFKAGILTPDQVIQELSAYGYDGKHIAWIMAYAAKSLIKIPKGTVTGLAALSVSTARTMFDEGLISNDQYVQVLVAHNYPQDLAEATAHAEELAAHVKQHKATIVDLIDEVNAGVITVDDALSNLHQQGFTQVEIARFQKGVKKASVINAKHPTMGEMKTLLKAGIITTSQYKNELQIQGWTDPWLTAFVTLESQPPPDQTTQPVGNI